MVEQWNKPRTLRIANEVEFRFVESEQEVQKFYDQQKYAIVKHSQNLKELILEGKFPLNKEFSNLKKGYYYIIALQKPQSEFKSQTKTASIAYALYRENKANDYGNIVYQVNINTLVNQISQSIFSNENINDYSKLEGQTIYIANVKEANGENKTSQVGWTGINLVTTPEELEKYNVPSTEDDMLLENQLMQQEFKEQDKAMYGELAFFDEQMSDDFF